tara:strand:- start:25044 stop:25262 length:219 start_codon:yes stop_codon:yes gene_type:complete
MAKTAKSVIKLENPSVDTWFIGWNDSKSKIEAYSLVSPKESMFTALNIVDYYTTEKSWLGILKANGIVPKDL